MKNKTITTFVLVALMSIISMTAFAANTSGEEDLATLANPGDPGVDPGATPISDYLLPMLVLGVAIGYRLLRKKTEIVD